MNIWSGSLGSFPWMLARQMNRSMRQSERASMTLRLGRVRSASGDLHLKLSFYGVFTPEQDNKTTTRHILNLSISMIPFTPGLSDLV